jgi:pimeloyl-ACP methyl ester carboxylesterase
MTFSTASPVTVGDLTFDVRRAGPEDGEPVVLLHGFPETSLAWTQVAARLADAGLRVLAPDQRGYSPGARPTDTAAYATPTLAQDVVDLADALGLDSFHLVGHDWGASVAWVVAARHGERLRTLTAVSVPHLAPYGRALQTDSDQQDRASYIGLMRTPGDAERALLDDDARGLRALYGGFVPPELVEAYAAHLGQPGAMTAALDWYRAMRGDLRDTPPVRVPTTFVWSDEDQAIGRVPAEQCGDFVDADYTFVELSGISHWIPEQAPGPLAAAIVARAAG